MLHENSQKRNVVYDAITGIFFGVIMAVLLFLAVILSYRATAITPTITEKQTPPQISPYENLAKQRVEYLSNASELSKWLENNRNRRIVSLSVMTYSAIVISEPFGITLEQ